MELLSLIAKQRGRGSPFRPHMCIKSLLLCKTLWFYKGESDSDFPPILYCLIVCLQIPVFSRVFLLTCFTNWVERTMFHHEHHNHNIHPRELKNKALFHSWRQSFRLLGTFWHKFLYHLPAFCPPGSQIPLETKVLVLRVYSSPLRKVIPSCLNPI